uniref:Uncharacterized protein n=1 Tax=Vitis vinifera TaxID=29760 RepID=A5BNX5_VITVI|nr:hypothetical protein VITISV_021236 [Vitis vinifera]
MARTRGAKSSSPSSRKRVPREAPIQGPTSEPPQPEAASPPAKPAPQNTPATRYLTRSGGRPLQKKARVQSLEPIDVTEQSPVPSPEPSPTPSSAPSSEPPVEVQEHQPPLSESQIPSGIAPEVLIRRPILTQPPIEGNLDYRARPFHSELCFDTATFKLRAELADSFHLLRRYRMEHLLSPRDFFYPRVAMDFYQSMTTNQVRDPTLIHFTINGRHGILGARHIAEALHIPYEPSHFEDYRVWTSPSQLEMILEHLGYPSDPQLELKRICQEPAEIPAARRASPNHIPEGIPIASPTISKAPPVTPASSEPSTSVEPRMAIPISEYRDLCRTLQTLTASTEQPCSGDDSYYELARSRLFEFDITQEVPLPPYNFNHPYHIEDNAQLDWRGRNEEGSMLSYFGNSAMLLFDHQSNMRLRRVIWNPWQSNGNLRNMKNQSFEVLFHKQIRNARRGRSQQSNASNCVQFGAEMKELQPLEAEHRKLKANFAALRNQPFAAK